jgi:hypothetical protein
MMGLTAAHSQDSPAIHLLFDASGTDAQSGFIGHVLCNDSATDAVTVIDGYRLRDGADSDTVPGLTSQPPAVDASGSDIQLGFISHVLHHDSATDAVTVIDGCWLRDGAGCNTGPGRTSHLLLMTVAAAQRQASWWR